MDTNEFWKANLQPLEPMFPHLFNILMSMFYHLLVNLGPNNKPKNAQKLASRNEFHVLCKMYCLIVLCIKACLGDKKRKNFLIHSTLLFHGKTKTKKVRMGIIHDETRRERKVVKSFVDIFSTAFFL